ncbi:hypothetical protein QJS83_02560 [Bdellovibrio sp. 22V]|uniref:hypothetical protein n=1 Tax=Bdellovibrio sp. 22V TaxID=3044166 RepID=UPI002543654D|nr:hypothetical protein [Bdellovibrio sp. 22V]WII72751.1 hypothetical protein QJS83_02560 [Bdellovibrio sp. 22V]
MKFLVASFMALSLCLVTNTSVAAEFTPEGGPGTLENVLPLTEDKMSLPDFAERLLTPQGNDDVENQTYTCRAWTTCPGGYQISCWSRGYRCSSSVIPGYKVSCSATSRSGYTRWWTYYCY